jgi:AraC-like DNA-binding protein
MFGFAGWYGVDGYREALFFIPTQHYFLLGPVIYFYSRFLMNPSFELSKADYLHFIPGLLYILYALVMFVTDVVILDELYFYADGRDKDLSPIYQFIGTAYVLGYLLISIRLYFAYKAKIFKEFSFAYAISYNWLKWFLIALSAILAARIIFLMIYPSWGDFGAKFWYYVVFSALFYYIALNGLVNTICLSIPYELPDLYLYQVAETPVYAIEDVEGWKARLNELIVEKALYRNPLLSLTDVSDELNINRKKVSTIINQGFGMNFNDYINSFRIEEIKKRFENGETEDFTVLGIALDSGFNSKTTFNRAFKKYTGSTPQFYIQKLKL